MSFDLRDESGGVGDPTVAALGGAYENAAAIAADETLSDGPGSEVLEGGTGTNTIMLSDDGEPDTVVVGQGIDIVYGGADIDRLVFRVSYLPSYLDGPPGTAAGLDPATAAMSGIPLLGGIENGPDGQEAVYVGAIGPVIVVGSDGSSAATVDETTTYFSEYGFSSSYVYEGDTVHYFWPGFTIDYFFYDAAVHHQLENTAGDGVMQPGDLLIMLSGVTADQTPSYVLLKDFDAGDFGIAFFPEQLWTPAPGESLLAPTPEAVAAINGDGNYVTLPPTEIVDNTYTVDSLDEQLVIEDYAGWRDRLILPDGYDPATLLVSLIPQTTDVVLSTPDADGSVTISQEFNGVLPFGIEQIAFSDGTLWGISDLQARYLEHAATEGDDWILGFDTSDTIDGLGGSDTVKSGAGDDVVTGGPGDNSLDGGAGTDTAVFSSDHGDYAVSYDAGTGASQSRTSARARPTARTTLST